MSSRGRFFRHQDRASYKASEVIGLFIISMGLGMIFFGLCVAVDHAIQFVLGYF